MIRSLIARLGRVLSQPVAEEMRAQRKALLARMADGERRLLSVIEQAKEKADQKTAKQQRTTVEIRDDLASLRAELRLRATRDQEVRPTNGPPIPLIASERPPRVPIATPADPLPAESVVDLAACPVCDDSAAAAVCEYNKLLLLRADVDDGAAIANYALCRACGIVSARRRPVGPRYTALLNRFETALGRDPGSGNRPLTSAPLTDDDRRDLRQRIQHGVFVSEHAGLSRRDVLPTLLRDRMAASVHVELLGSLLPLRAPRVLELRPRTGAIGASLRRLYDADVVAMPLFEGQQFLIREAYGIPADHRIDYDRFTIPYDGTFDLIVANHMLTHAVRPREFLSTVRERLAPGGHLYLYNEPDEREFLTGGKSMINTLNPFHMQTFDRAALLRGLAACGFAPVFVTHERETLVVIAKPTPIADAWISMPSEEGARRRAAYEQARDLAILQLPERVRSVFGQEWDAVVERSYAAGLVEFDPRGRLRLARKGAQGKG